MSQSTESLFTTAIREASAASTNPSRWLPCLEAIGAAVKAPGYALFTPQPLPHAGALAIGGTMQGGAQAYFQHWGKQDPWLAAIAGRSFFQTAGEVRFGHEFIADADLVATAYHNDYGRHYGGGRKLVLAVISDGDTLAPTTTLSLSRSFARPAFGTEERTILKRVWPYLRDAVQTQRLLSHAPLLRRMSEASLAAIPHPCLIVRGDGWIEHANPAGEALRRTAKWLTVGGGRMSSAGDLDEGGMRLILKQAVLGLNGQACFVYTDRNGQRRRATLLAAPIAQASQFVASWPLAQALITFNLPDEASDQDWADHVEHLTLRQRAILRLVAAGRDTASIAAELSIHATTVKTHIRNIYAKTGCRSRSELVRLILTGSVRP